jgi:hypothetical protein
MGISLDEAREMLRGTESLSMCPEAQKMLGLEDARRFISQESVKILNERKPRRSNPHEQFVGQIVKVAHLHHWKVASFRPARVRIKGIETWRTAWGADGKGFPDLILVRAKPYAWGRAPSLLFWEVKVGKDKPTPEQTAWLELLGGRVVMPDDWDWITESLK